jgi:23S rRNA pseudouridine2605 synthase
LQIIINDNKEQRIERIISNRGGGSRSEVSAMIRHGRVKVNGRVIRSGSLKIKINHDNITVDDIILQSIPLLMIYNKPIGVHSTIGDPYNRLNLLSLYDECSYLQHMHPVGRLDADTSGLLLFSKDGMLTQYLLSPSNEVPRVYEAIVVGNIDEEKKDFIKNTLNGM